MIYKFIIRPVLFLFNPESVHRFVVRLIRFFMIIPGIRYLMTLSYCITDKSLERNVFGLKFRNPVGLAAGFDKNAEYYNELSVFGFSFIEIGTVTPRAQPGNPRPRSFRLVRDKALINRMGINNSGASEIASNIRKNHPGVIIGGNIGKNTSTSNDDAINDYIECFNELKDVVDYFVVNISCPNIGDIEKLQDADTLTAILSALKKLSLQLPVPRPVLLKISPDLNDQQLDDVILIAIETGIDGFVATNTTITRKNLITEEDKVESIGKGGLSGLPLKNRSTAVIKHLVGRLGGRLPVIGVGGIMDPDDAIEKLQAGASLVQIYTGFIYEGPALPKKINKALLRRHEL
jgi:dihydroorotate dehydrogenase